MPDSRCDIAIVGGGPAGLALGVRLQQAGCDVQVFEAHDRAGGNVRSEARDGYLCEWGPNGFLDNEPAMLRLVDDLGLRDQLVRASAMAEKRWVVRRGRLRALPKHPLRFLFGDILSLPGRVRAGLEWTQPPRRDTDDESVFDFARRRVGREAAEVLVDAMVTGVYAGDARELSLRSTFPRMQELEQRYGGLFRAMRALRREKRGGKSPGGGGFGPSGALHSFVNGMQTLTDSLATRLGARLHLGAPLERLESSADGWRLHLGGAHTVHSEQVVMACPAWTAAPLLHHLDADLALELAAIPSAPVAVVCLGFAETDVEPVERGFGFLVPGREASPVLGTLYDTWVFPNRSQVGTVLFRTLLGGARHPAILQQPDEELVRLSRETLRMLLGLDAIPAMVHVVRHRRGIAQYTLGHAERLARIDARLREHPGLWLSGASYRGVALNACVREAEELSQRLRQATVNEPGRTS